MRQEHKAYTLDHLNRETYYKFNTGIDEVGGNTAALMMIRKKVFETMGGFNESFRHCYEDAILGLQLIKNGYNNYCNGECVAYHHESQTREIENNKIEMVQDFNEHVYPFIKENFEKFKKYTIIAN
jgi:GT2 family glycosyltransferase